MQLRASTQFHCTTPIISRPGRMQGAISIFVNFGAVHIAGGSLGTSKELKHATKLAKNSLVGQNVLIVSGDPDPAQTRSSFHLFLAARSP